MAISSHGTTFTFTTSLGAVAAKVTSLSVEEATQELVDMTGIGDPLSERRILTTGDVTSPAKVQIDYMRRADDLTLLPPGSMGQNFPSGVQGTLQISHGPTGMYLEKNANVESSTTEMAVGDVIRGKITFVINNATT